MKKFLVNVYRILRGAFDADTDVTGSSQKPLLKKSFFAKSTYDRYQYILIKNLAEELYSRGQDHHRIIKGLIDLLEVEYEFKFHRSHISNVFKTTAMIMAHREREAYKELIDGAKSQQ